MTMREPTDEDRRAAGRLLGRPAPDFVGVRMTAQGVWNVVSDSNPLQTYRVEEREDTRNHPGTFYFHCTCPSWGIKFGKGLDCKHIVRVRLSRASDEFRR